MKNVHSCRLSLFKQDNLINVLVKCKFRVTLMLVNTSIIVSAITIIRILATNSTLVNVYVDLVVFTRIAGTS